MTKVTTYREIGTSDVWCDECEWMWEPRVTTKTTGSVGARNAMMAAKGHCLLKGHKVIITRLTSYKWPYDPDYTKKYQANRKRKRQKKAAANKQRKEVLKKESIL